MIRPIRAIALEARRRLSPDLLEVVDAVHDAGEFAVRGGIVDVFPPTEEHPLRVEFWGDEIEGIRSFAVDHAGVVWVGGVGPGRAEAPELLPPHVLEAL